MAHALPPSREVTSSQISVSPFTKRINYLDKSTNMYEENMSDIFLDTEDIYNSNQDTTMCS